MFTLSHSVNIFMPYLADLLGIYYLKEQWSLTNCNFSSKVTYSDNEYNFLQVIVKSLDTLLKCVILFNFFHSFRPWLSTNLIQRNRNKKLFSDTINTWECQYYSRPMTYIFSSFFFTFKSGTGDRTYAFAISTPSSIICW